MREVQPWLGKVESSKLPILLLPTSDMQYTSWGGAPSPVNSPPAGGGWSGGGAGESGRAWERGGLLPGGLCGGGGTEVVAVERLPSRKLLPDYLLHIKYFIDRYINSQSINSYPQALGIGKYSSHFQIDSTQQSFILLPPCQNLTAGTKNTIPTSLIPQK